MASPLLKFCHWIEDTEGDSMDLRFLSTDKRAIDFVVLRHDSSGKLTLLPFIPPCEERQLP